MRIGILTFHKAINYGAYLQSFSLSNKLKKQFPDAEVEIIDYEAPKERKRKLYVLLWNIKHHGLKGGLSEIKRMCVFKSMQKHLPLSPKSFCTQKLQTLYSYIDNRYDALIIGSDAVFNWNQTKFPTAFIPDFPFKIPVYTYAASVHGLHFYTEAKDKLQLCGKVFDSMNCVGVRDNCSEQFVKLCSPNAKTLHCCDPTLFIDKEEIYKRGIDVNKRLKKKHGFSIDSKYIVVMVSDSSLVKAVAEKYGKDYKIVSAFVKSAYSDIYLSDLNPFEWTVILKQASLVITSYFHGTLLSLVQGTPTVVLDYSDFCNDRYESKLRDLMITRLSLPEFYFDKEFAVKFNNNDEFFIQTQKMLSGEYRLRINDSIANEAVAINHFIEALKSEKKILQ